VELEFTLEATNFAAVGSLFSLENVWDNARPPITRTRTTTVATGKSTDFFFVVTCEELIRPTSSTRETGKPHDLQNFQADSISRWHFMQFIFRFLYIYIQFFRLENSPS
jgi:hypothetical protein